MSEAAEPRDGLVGAALRELEVPEHGEDFWPGLGELLAGQSQPKVGAGDIRPLRRNARLGGRRALLAAAALAGIVVAVVLGVRLLGGAEIATAAEIRARILSALASIDSLSGVVYNRDSGGESRWRFVLTARGDFRLTGLGKNPTDLAYDAGKNVEYYSDLGLFTIRTGLAPGAPDPDTADYVVNRNLAATIQALDASGDLDAVRVDEIEHEGRPAWLLRLPTQNEGEVREVTVDRATGLPVREVTFYRGDFAFEYGLDELRVDAPVSPSTFTLEAGPAQNVQRYGAGFWRTPLEKAAERVGYAPLAPGFVPERYELAEVATARLGGPTGNEQAQNPQSRGVVSIAYRRGLQRIVVSTRLIGADRSLWGDPVTRGAPAGPLEQVVFSGGALDGIRGELVIDPNSVPHVWALTDRLVVTVAGDLTGAELVQVAESLRPLE